MNDASHPGFVDRIPDDVHTSKHKEEAVNILMQSYNVVSMI
jgi:hypothetical protein